MKHWEHGRAYSWAEQRRRDRRERFFEYAVATICVLGTVGMVTLFVYMLSA